MERLKPTLHEDFGIGTKVKFNIDLSHPDEKICGTIAGVSTCLVVFFYIILLDVPLLVPGYDTPWLAITMPGSCLEKA